MRCVPQSDTLSAGYMFTGVYWRGIYVCGKNPANPARVYGHEAFLRQVQCWRFKERIQGRDQGFRTYRLAEQRMA